MTIQADVPDGAYLNWSILNTAGEVVPGMQGSNEFVVPINLLDHSLVDQFRLHLEFKGSASGMPEVHSITGDGAYREAFITDPLTRGWTMSNATYIPGIGVLGVGVNSTLTSPWVLANAPLYDARLDGNVMSGQVQARFHPDAAWTNITLPFAPTANQHGRHAGLRRLRASFGRQHEQFHCLECRSVFHGPFEGNTQHD